MGKNREYRNTLFNYLDGIAVLSTINTLLQKKIFQKISESNSTTFQEICSGFKANPGYLNVAFRLCISQGWIIRTQYLDGEDYNISLTKNGMDLIQFEGLISQFSEILLKMENIENEFLNPFKFETGYFVSNLNKIENGRLKNILLSSIIGPLFVAIGMKKLKILNSDNTKIEFKNLKINSNWQSLLLNFLQISNIIQTIENPQLTKFGQFILKRASAFGVTVSYLPLLNKTKELFFNNPNVAHERSNIGEELHVDRTMNVWGSGGAHRVYFEKIDAIVKNIFNQPLDQQPKGIADMGCGNGEFLKHLYFVVKNETERGKHLDKFPLWIIGADFNDAALKSSKVTLDDAEIDHFLVKGNIGDPKGFAEELAKEKIDLSECLNVRSFLDHNRLLEFPLSKNPDLKNIEVKGAFSYKGEWVSGIEVLSDFVNHIQKWKPFINKFGLILLELHTIDSIEAKNSLGQNAATAYDATHGYSDQYIIDFDSFQNGIKFAGLNIHKVHSFQFPNQQNTAISISYILDN